MSDIHTFAGLTIDGDIVAGAVRKNQRPKEELAPLLQAVLDDDAIVSFGWKQYTPYFNDGEPCVFDANRPWVRTTWDAADADLYDLEASGFHPTLGTRQWDSIRNIYVGSTSEHFDQARYDRCQAMADAIDSGHFDDALIELFGDHAKVTVTRQGITVDFYEHD